MLNRLLALAILLGTLAGILPLGACSTEKSPLYGRIFVPLPPAVEVKHQPRRSPFKKEKPVDLAAAEDVVVPEKIDWRAIYASLPRDDEGVVDWMKALTEKFIKPKPGIDPNAKDGDIEEVEVEFVPNKDSGMGKITFRHAKHTQWLTCDNCHTAIFEMSEGLNFTHEDMEKRKYCGVCHEKVVFLPSGCDACHAKTS